MGNEMKKTAAIISQGTPAAEAIGRLMLDGWTVDVKPNHGLGDLAAKDRGWNPTFVPHYDAPDNDTIEARVYGGKVMFIATR